MHLCCPQQVVANQLVLGPCVLLVVFAWNMAWMGKAKGIPDKYRRDFFPALVDGQCIKKHEALQALNPACMVVTTLTGLL